MTNWRLVHFEPWDILVNADARGLGDGGYGFEGEIAPGAFAGAVRTLVLRQSGYDFSKDFSSQNNMAKEAAEAVGLRGEDFSFRFAGPFLCEKGLADWNLFFRSPAHLLRAPGNDYVPAGWLVPNEAKEGIAKDGELGDCCLLEVSATSSFSLDQAEPLEGWASASQLQKILRGELGSVASLRPERHFYVHERKEGHRRSKTGTVEEGALFSRGALRFRDEDPRRTFGTKHFAGLLRLDNNLLPNGVYDIRLAGDGRPARLRVEEANTLLKPLLEGQEDLARRIAAAKKFLIYLATPAVFQEGWTPKDWASVLGIPANIGLKLAGACVPRPRILGGWDLKAGEPKPVRRAAPSGSVYFFSYQQPWQEDHLAAWLKELALERPVSSEDGPLGYGWVLVGLWPESGLRQAMA